LSPRLWGCSVLLLLRVLRPRRCPHACGGVPAEGAGSSGT